MDSPFTEATEPVKLYALWSNQLQQPHPKVHYRSSSLLSTIFGHRLVFFGV